MSVQNNTDYKHFAAFLHIMVHSLDRYKHPAAVRMRTDGRIQHSTVQKCHDSGREGVIFGSTAQKYHVLGRDSRIQYSTAQKHPISGRVKDVFGCGGQIREQYRLFLFAQVPRRAD